MRVSGGTFNAVSQHPREVSMVVDNRSGEVGRGGDMFSYKRRVFSFGDS